MVAEEKAVIDWVHQDCIDWGDYIRRTPKAWPGKSMCWKLWRERGADRGQQIAVNPEWDWPQNVMDIHRAYRNMPGYLSDVMRACYAQKWNPEKAARQLNMGKSKMYQLRSHCHYFIVGQMVEKNPPECVMRA